MSTSSPTPAFDPIPLPPNTIATVHAGRAALAYVQAMREQDANSAKAAKLTMHRAQLHVEGLTATHWRVLAVNRRINDLFDANRKLDQRIVRLMEVYSRFAPRADYDTLIVVIHEDCGLDPEDDGDCETAMFLTGQLMPPGGWPETTPEPTYDDSAEQARAFLARVSTPIVAMTLDEVLNALEASDAEERERRDREERAGR